MQYRSCSQGAPSSRRLLSFRDAELMQYRSPVGAGPSSNTWPRCAPHRAQLASVLIMPKLVSGEASTDLSEAGRQKLGQPVPESNFAPDSNRGAPQHAHRYVPVSLQSWYLPVNGGSVPPSTHTRCCSGVSESGSPARMRPRHLLPPSPASADQPPLPAEPPRPAPRTRTALFSDSSRARSCSFMSACLIMRASEGCAFFICWYINCTMRR